MKTSGDILSEVISLNVHSDKGVIPVRIGVCSQGLDGCSIDVNCTRDCVLMNFVNRVPIVRTIKKPSQRESAKYWQGIWPYGHGLV
jgi:hypothetical protein